MGDDFSTVPAVDHLRCIAQQFPDKLAIDDGSKQLTFSELLRHVDMLAVRIAAEVPEGEAVGILEPNSVWYPVAMLASMAAGRPSVPLNTRDPGTRINEVVNAARLSALIGAGPPDCVTRNIAFIDATASVPAADSGALPCRRSSSRSVDAPAIVLYTSGSTGHPKGIVNSQRSLLRRVQQYVDACHIDSDDVFLPLTSPATIAGCREVLAALLSGATLHLLEIEAVGLRAARSRMQAERVTVTYLVPALLRALMADACGNAFASLRVARVGGEKVSAHDIELLRKAVSNGCLIQVGYSSTETTGSQWFLPRDWSETDTSVPVGRLLPGVTFAIVDEDGDAVPPGEGGELLIRSRFVLLGHWENGTVVPAESDPDDPSIRIFATGDLVRLDKNGLLHVLGRKGRQIKINGRRVEPAELERVLRSDPLVQDAVAIVVGSHELVAFAVPRQCTGTGFSDDLRRLITETLPAPLRPLRLHTVSAIPRLPGGKVDLPALAKIDASAKSPQPDTCSPNTASDLRCHTIVQRAWTRILNTRVAAGNWDEAGGDSLKLLHCVLEIESAIGRELNLETLTTRMSVDEMVKAVALALGDDLTEVRPADTVPILFLFPGSVGYGPSLAAFAAAMGNTARVAPIRYPGLKNILGGQATLSAMAAAALDQISRAQPSGDVRLLGHSLGGAVAFEVAARLLEAGRSVKFLGILDTSIVGERSAYRETIRRMFDRIRTNRVTASRMACRALAKGTVALGWEKQLASTLDRASNGNFNPTSFRVKLELQEVLRARAFFAWLLQPKPVLPITGTLFRCEREGASATLGWDQAFEGLEIFPIAGGHLDLVVEPHLAINRPLIEKAVAQTCSRSLVRRGESRPSTGGRTSNLATADA